MESAQRSVLLYDESVDMRDVRTANGIKRKRRCTQTPTDTDQTPPPQKKTTPCDQEQTRESVVDQQLNNNGNNGTTDKSHHEEEDDNQFSLEHFCDEVLYEIFKFLDTWSLMTLMNVSKRFQKFVLDRRLWEEIDLSQEPLPLGILEDMLERSHEKTRSIKLRGPSPSQHIEGEIQHFNKTLRHSLTTRCTKLMVMELFGVTLDFNQLTFKDFPATLQRLVLSNCNVRVDVNRSIFTGIDTILVNLEELAIEKNAWFDPYYVMPIAKLPILRYLSLKGCSQMQEFIPYGSIAGRHGFKQLEILDLSETPLNDSDLQCFNAVETLKEIYLQCPEEDIKTQVTIPTNTDATTEQSENDAEQPSTSSSSMKPEAINGSASPATTTISIQTEGDTEQPSTSSSIKPKEVNGSSTLATSTSCATNANEIPATSTAASKLMDVYLGECPDAVNSFPISSSSSSSSSSSPSASLTASQPSTSGSVPADANAQPSSLVSNNSPMNVIALVGSNTPARSRFLPRPDHIIYVDCRNRTSPNAFHISLRDRNNLREPRMVFHRHRGQQQQLSPPPSFEQMMRRNIFWDIINPLGRAAGGGGPDRLFGEENEIEYGGANIHHNPFNIFNSSRPRGSISDRGVCCFGRTRDPVQHGVIWIRFNNRPIENRFERFSVRDYKSVTDTSLEHLVQCSPHLVFLDVSGTSVTMKGIRVFKELKPECKVVAEHLLSTVL